MNKIIDSVTYDHVTLCVIRGTEKPGPLTKVVINKPYPEVTATLTLQKVALTFLQRKASKCTTSRSAEANNRNILPFCLTYQDKLMWLLLGQQQAMITCTLPSEISVISD